MQLSSNRKQRRVYLRVVSKTPNRGLFPVLYPKPRQSNLPRIVRDLMATPSPLAKIINLDDVEEYFNDHSDSKTFTVDFNQKDDAYDQLVGIPPQLRGLYIYQALLYLSKDDALPASNQLLKSAQAIQQKELPPNPTAEVIESSEGTELSPEQLLKLGEAMENDD
jgi:hypothetical protein